MIDEMGWVPFDSEKMLERQSIEADADRRSTFSRIASIELQHLNHSKEIPAWANSVESPKKLLFDWTLAVNILFRLFGDIRFSPKQLLHEFYPPLPLRRMMVSGATLACASSWDAITEDDSAFAVRTAVKYCEYAFATILGENPSMEGVRNANSLECREHNRLLVKFWYETMRDRIVKHSYEPDLIGANEGLKE